MPYAYVVYDHAAQRTSGRSATGSQQHDIILAGRYSEWEYYNSDHAFLAGKKAAEAALSAANCRRRWSMLARAYRESRPVRQRRLCRFGAVSSALSIASATPSTTSCARRPRPSDRRPRRHRGARHSHAALSRLVGAHRPLGWRAGSWDGPTSVCARLRELGIEPIVGFVHHGSGPRRHAPPRPWLRGGAGALRRAVRGPLSMGRAYTPVNEPLTTARFSGLTASGIRTGGRPQLRPRGAESVRGVAQRDAGDSPGQRERGARADRRSRAIYASPPAALSSRFRERSGGGSHGTCSLDASTATHPLRGYLRRHGIAERARVVSSAPCKPRVIGINHYLTSDRFLRRREIASRRSAAAVTAAIATRTVGAVGARRRGMAVSTSCWPKPGSATASASRSRKRTWDARVRISCAGFARRWPGPRGARGRRCRRAVTVWALLGSFDWDSLVTSRGHYEPGAFDVRGPARRG